jgi:WD40 repeat protein
MNQERDSSVSIVNLSTSANGEASLLLNVADIPVDASEVSSAIHHLTTSPAGYSGEVAYATQEWLTSMAFHQDGSIFAASADGSVHIFDGSTWQVVEVDPQLTLNCAYAINASTAVVGASDGSIHRVTSSQSQIVSQPTGVRINAIDGCSPDCAYAVGDDGQAVIFDGAQWAALNLPTQSSLLSVLCLAPDDVYIGGTQGTLLHWTGADWQRIDAPPVTISSLARYHDKIFAAGGKDGVFTTDGGPLQPAKALTIYRLAASQQFLFAAGSQLFAWHDGDSWRGGTYTLGSTNTE